MEPNHVPELELEELREGIWSRGKGLKGLGKLAGLALDGLPRETAPPARTALRRRWIADVKARELCVSLCEILPPFELRGPAG